MIRRNAKRFLAILSITALGLTAFLGITAACRDMYLAADRFYDRQQLFDIRVLSTLGLTDEDVKVLRDIPGVELADGSFSETVYIMLKDVARKKAEMVTISTQGLNMPYLVEGRLPRQAGEIAVTQEYLDESEKSIGDILTIEEDLENGEEAGSPGQEAAAEETTGSAEQETTAEETTGSPEQETTAEETTGSPERETAAEKKTDSKEREAAEEKKMDNAEQEVEADQEADNTEQAVKTDFDSDIDWDAEVQIEEEEETPVFLNTKYTITGVVVDPMDISNNKSVAFRSAAAADYTFYITPADVDGNVYTAVYLTLQGVSGLDCYSDEYTDAVRSVINIIETQIMEQREQVRYETIMGEVLEKITDAESIMNDNFSEADQKFSDAWADVEEAKQELTDGETELTGEEKDALKKLADARTKLKDGKKKLRDAQTETDEGKAKLEESEQELKSGRIQLTRERREAEEGFAGAKQQFAKKQTELDASRSGLLQNIEELQAPFGSQWPQDRWNALISASAAKTAEMISADPESSPDPALVAAATTEEQNALASALGAVIPTLENVPQTADTSELIGSCIEAGLGLGIIEGSAQVLEEQKTAYKEQETAALQQLADAEAKLDQGEAQLEAARRKIKEGQAEIEEGWAEIAENEEKLNAEEAKALRELKKAWEELDEGKQELAEGEAKLIENEEKYKDKRAEAEDKLADAYAELEEIDMAQWYVQDRTSVDSYSSLDSDLSSVEAIGRVFPILFLVVAVLICLTTMTRLVEEERGLIGTYKALGFGNAAIGLKYIIYSLLASAAGSILGNLLGFIVLPKLLIDILRSIYIIPNTALHFDTLEGMAGTLLFMGCIVLATVFACNNELRRMPASLMRPKAPGSGSRIILERISVVWNRLGFLNKVTARNLFRYKKRLFMTVIGIAGCTALVLTGFAIKDSVTDMMPKQYENIYRYDLMAISDAEDNDKLIGYLSDDEAVADFLSVRLESIKVFNAAGDSEGMQMIVVPSGAFLEPYIYTPNQKGEAVQLDDKGIFITSNAAEQLDLKPGDTLALQNLQLDRHSAVVSDIVDNYLGNSVLISQTLYEALFGEYEANAAYAHFTEAVADQVAYADDLLEEEYVLSSASVQRLKEEFSDNFVILNSVIFILIVLAAGLAFVVLFTLSNTNISERVRELATIKVLGFYDNEVHAYVNKETLILSLIGVLAGLPLGHVLSGLLLAALKMPSFQFELVIQPGSYFIAGIASLCFALIVNLLTNRILDRINMVEALKSIE